MLVSVLIAAYHAAAHLPGALRSLESQTHPDWELVVVEDGSRDGTEALVNTFAARHPARRVAYENLGQNRGVAAARNRLLSLARGDTLAFLDADDLWSPAHLAALVAALRPGAALAFSALELWDGDQHRSLGEYRPPSACLASPRAALFARSFIQTSSCVALPRAVAAQVGDFDETLRIGEDRDYWFRALALGGLAFAPEPSCRYTKHAGSSMTRTRRVAADTVAFYRKHASAADISPALRRDLLAESLWTHARLLRRDQRPASRRLAREALRLRPLRLRYWPHALL